MAKEAGKTTRSTSPKKSLDELLSRQRVKVFESDITSTMSDKNDVVKEEPIKNMSGVGNTKKMVCADNDGMTFSDLVSLFGEGFNEHEMRVMYKKFVAIQNNYPLRTEMHEESLVTYVKYAFKRDKAIADDDIEAADKWGKLASKAATDAKINPNQLSAADLSGGMTCFSQVSATVERAQDIIPLLNRFIEQPQDRVDYTIWQYVNYSCHLNNKPLALYKDLYRFLRDRYEENKDKLSFLFDEGDGLFDEKDLGG